MVLPPWNSQFEEGMVGCHAQVDKSHVGSKPITGRYFVNSLEGIEEEQADEDMTTMKTGPVDVIDEVTMADVERLEGEGSTVVSPAAVEKMEGAEKSKWIDGMKDEMNSMGVREVFDDATATDLNERYWRKGIKTKKTPAKMVVVKKPLHDGAGGWKARARVVCCGNLNLDMWERMLETVPRPPVPLR